MVCKKCKYTMWPKYIANHLKNVKHRIKHQTTQKMQQAMQAHMDIHQSPNKFETINHVEQKIPELAIHQGVKCTSDNGCKYICVRKNNMKKHWSQQHRGVRNKRNNRSKSRRREEHWDKWKPIACQKFFIQLRGNNYFNVKTKKENTIPSENKITQKLQLLEKNQKTIKKNQQKKIQKKKKTLNSFRGWKRWDEKHIWKNWIEKICWIRWRIYPRCGSIPSPGY